MGRARSVFAVLAAVAVASATGSAGVGEAAPARPGPASPPAAATDDDTVVWRGEGRPAFHSSDATDDHRVQVVAIDNRGTLPSDDVILAGVDAALAHWAGDLPDAFDSFERSGDVVHYDSSAAPGQAQGCGVLDPETVWQEAGEQADPVPGAANHLVVVVPESCAAGALAGKGSLGDGVTSGGAVIARAVDRLDTVVAHELGHNLGLQHGNRRLCARATAACIDEYGDSYSVMGNGRLPALPSAMRAYLGQAPATEVTPVTAPGTSTLTLAPRGTSSGRRGLRVVDPQSGAVWFVDYRTAAGLDSGEYWTFAPPDLLPELEFAPGVSITRLHETYGPGPLEEPGQSEVQTHDVGGVARAFWQAGEIFEAGAVRVAVDATDGAAATVRVTLTAGQQFSAVGSPRITGPTAAGSTLRLDVGAWSPAPTSFRVTWTVDGRPWQEQTGGASSFSVRTYSFDAGSRIGARVTAVRTGYTSVTRDAPAFGPLLATLKGTTPFVLGVAKVGKQVRVTPKNWTPGTTFTYAWAANGVVVRGATKPTLTLTRAREGKRITVAVTGRKPGYAPLTRTSLPSKPVAP